MFGVAKLKIWALVVCWLVPCIVLGQPSISGNLSGNLGRVFYRGGGLHGSNRAESGYRTRNHTALCGHFFFFVNGRLTAEGTAAIPFNSDRSLPSHCIGGRLEIPGWRCFQQPLLLRHGSDPEPVSSAAYGGAIFVQNTTLNLSHSRMAGSHAAMGGGLYGENATLSITNCVFAADSSDDDGAASPRSIAP